jgi:pyridoxamine 5'-phosphate oxidase-like protein
MSKFIADHLPGQLLAHLSPATAIQDVGVAIVICTVDEHGWPHPAMFSRLEVVARDARNVRLATHVASRTTRNLKANGKLSLVFADTDAVHYVKGDVLLLEPSMRVAPHLAKFNLRVDSVLADDPQAYEDARIVSGLTFERRGIDPAAARAILEELLE